MISFPSCKINLGLQVLSKRADGYHNLETCFYPVPWNDVLEIVHAKETKLTVTGISIPGEDSSNMVYKAFQLLKSDFSIDPVEIHLHKIIPHGAGLGGGSSDATHALVVLNRLFLINLTNVQLKSYALKLGSDCPFFLESAPMVATGRGEVLSPIDLNLSGITLVIIKPDINVSTAGAYSGIVPRVPEVDISSILKGHIKNWKELLKNDFEENVFLKHPVIKRVKAKLYGMGAVYTSMSGSGSAVFGLFESAIKLEKEFSGMTVWSSVL